MNVPKSFITLAIGFTAGIAFILSCGGDDSTPLADAAVQCDCPASEAPLAGRITRATAEEVVPAMNSFGAVAFCDADAIMVSGGCFINSTSPLVTLSSSHPAMPEDNPRGWVCSFYNGTAAPVTSKAYVTCLKPAAQ